jgi:predicted type IV restriction endonuclease
MATLNEMLSQVRQRVNKYRGAREVNEQDTKATLIQPILRTLGWDVEELEDVRREYKRRKQDMPVDYACCSWGPMPVR